MWAAKSPSTRRARLLAFVDALLLDSGNQKLAVKELGGTGRVHDWRISRRIRDAVDVPLFLAGGLNAGNVAAAVRRRAAARRRRVQRCAHRSGSCDAVKVRAFVAGTQRRGRASSFTPKKISAPPNARSSHEITRDPLSARAPCAASFA